MRRRTSPAAWCAAGLVLLRDHGLEALTVDRLCASLEKTKGSFYHHFRDLEAFQDALLTQWEEDLTQAVIGVAGREPDPLKRGVRLDSVVRGLDHRLDSAVRAWALRSERAHTALERVDRRRIDYLTKLFRESGYRQPRLLAELKYIAFVGAQQTGVVATPKRAAHLAEALRQALGWLGNKKQ